MQNKILWMLAIILGLLLIYGLLWLLDTARQQARLRVTGFNSHFTIDPAASFATYVSETANSIKLARTKAGTDTSLPTIAANSPRMLFPDEKACPKPADGKYKNGIVFLHGLLDSPYTLDVLGKFFQKKCFVVYTVLLTGHGTVPGDLLDVQSDDWEALTHFATAKISEQVNNIYLMGYSLGGLLAVNEALKNPDRYKALILFGPCLTLKTRYQNLVPLLYALSYIIPQLKWVEIHKDNIQVRYESFPANAVYQIYKILTKVNGKLATQTLQLPIFLEQSADDMTVNAEANREFFNSNSNKLSKLLWYTKTASTSDTRIQEIAGAVPDLKILDISHLAYLISADDKIYGLHGSYKECLHYLPDSPQRQQCEAGDNTYLGEITPQNLAAHVIQRLTFNPFQPELFAELSAFITALD
jgi:esterase/lipase